MRIYNTLTRKIEEFRPINLPNVGMYTCGMTVYDYAHIGHARTYVFADILRRVLTFNGFEVKQVENVTDVGHLTEADISDEGEDKVEKAAREERKSAWEIAKFYMDDFYQMTDKLNILRPTVICRATDHIKEQIEMIKKLEKKGFTYRIDRGVCFDTSKFPTYADFARLDLKGIKVGARVERDPQKKNPTDFWLWKFSEPGIKRQMEWDSPWGRGFPGWHIECSAMSIKYLGEHFDIHTGGVDHIPVHHTNEIAQNEALYKHKVVNYWCHGEHLIIEGQKMSKSLKNFIRVVDLERKGFDPPALRYLFLTTHYRSKMNFTWKGLEAGQTAYRKLVEMIKEWQRGDREVVSQEDVLKIDSFRKKFQEKINDDLNIPEALAVVWEVAKSNIPSPDKLDLVLDFDKVLGLKLEEVSKVTKVSKVPKEIKELIEKRELLRKQEKWDEADRTRKEIEKSGFIIEDTPEGPKVKKKAL
ncbi:MAG: cysteine--tRNA ligase [Patescibacteria group bacterium]